MDPLMPAVVAALLVVLLVVMGMRWLRQPHVVAYLAAGVALGPHGLGLVSDEATLSRLGDTGVILLLFFVGTEVSIPALVRGWRVAIVGTLLQILASIGCVWLLGWWLDWPPPRIVLVGFAVSLSSTAVVVSTLRAWGRLDSAPGRDALAILLAQDMAIVPMLLVLGRLAGDSPSRWEMAGQLVGGLAVLLLLALVARGRRLSLPFGAALREDHELQVFSAFVLCFGMALATALLGLSTALGAFVAGVLVADARETEWVHRSLEPFRVVMVALFFVSIGMLVDLSFLAANWLMLAVLVLVTLVTNSAINTVILRGLGRSWRTSIHIGAILAQIGEFSFVLAAIGRQGGIVTGFGYQTTLSLIALTMVLSPAWIGAAGRLVQLPAPGGSAR